MHALAALLCCLNLAAQPAAQPTSSTPAPAQVMVVGTFHFAGGADAVQAATRDILGETGQAQIEEVVKGLERFKPDTIVVEYPAAEQPKLDTIYQQYRDGKRATSKNETDQVACRLAARLGHDRIHAFDHPANMDFGSLMQCAQETGRPELIAGFQAKIGQITAWTNDLQATTTIGEQLAVMNDTRFVEGSHRLYMGLLDFDTADRHPAQALLAAWYDRNLKMHASMRATIKPGGRVLVLVGASHAKLLRDFIAQDPATTIVDPGPYLPAPPPEAINRLLSLVGPAK